MFLGTTNEGWAVGTDQLHIDGVERLLRSARPHRALRQLCFGLDIQTGEVSNSEGGGLIAPYSSIVYDTLGGTWVYTSPKALTFHRRSVVVETIKGGKAYLKEGPPPGTTVVTVGVAELYGTEKGLGH